MFKLGSGKRPFQDGRCASSAHRQQVPKAQQSPTEHRRPHCKQDERVASSCLTVWGTRHPLTGNPLHLGRKARSSELHLAGYSLSRKHGLATFVHERLKWILIDQAPPTSEIEWVCVDVDNYKIVNVYKPPPTRMQASNLPAFPHPCLYAGDFNCHHVDWGYANGNPDGECLAGPMPTTSPCYIAPRRPPVSTLAAGKQTPTQILHLPVSIRTVAYLTDVS